ncbi:DUF4139 domain-containing protein [Xenophilus aerolatus]|nr:DUF4139 domain-containing protein [Xenophilus aerolatus]
MPFLPPPLLRPAPLLAALAAALALPAAALDVPTPAAVASRIAQVKVYPGSATVERVARIPAGSRSITLACLPAGLDVQSLQVSADASVRVGETSVVTEPRALSAACATSALDGRIRALEDQKATLQAERDALGLVTGYLKGLGGGGDGDARRPALDARNLAATADALRRTGQESLLRQHQIDRGQEDLDRQLQPLLAERQRSQGGANGQVTAVTVTLDAPREAELRLSYQVAGPGWTPTYRALLDTTTRKLRIERQALVAQATGEDWRGVKLVLSTGQPRRNTAGRTPVPWRIGVEPPQQQLAREDSASRLAMVPAPAAPMAAAKAMAPERPLFDVNVFQNSFATEFDVTQPIDVPSNGQRVAMPLGQHEDTAQVAVRVSPRLEAAGYLVADMAQPEGVWPAGALQLYCDGAFVGSGQWSAPGNVDGPARVTLSFGRDELVRVTAEPERDNQGSGGFAGSRVERQVQRAYLVESRHRTPIALQVLEAAPVSVNDQVRVAAQFSPQPAELAWNRQPGVAMWRAELKAGQSARFTADYTIGFPKDARLQER